MQIIVVPAHLLINIWEALPLISLWGEFLKTILGTWIIIILPSMLDIMVAMLCRIVNATLVCLLQLVTFMKAPPGRIISMEVIGGIFNSHLLAVMGIFFINHPLVVMGEVFIL